MVGHPIRYKNTFLELDVPRLDLRRLVTSPGRLEEEQQKTPTTPTLLSRRGMPPLRHLCSPFEQEEACASPRSSAGSDSTEDELQPAEKNPQPVRFKAHFVGLAKQAQTLDFRGLYAELLELRRARPAAVQPSPESEQASAQASTSVSSPPSAGLVAHVESWADMESDEETVTEVQPARQSWADVESDDDDSSSVTAAAVERAPTPPRARARADSSPRRVRVVSWAEPVAAAYGEVPDAFAPGTPRAAKETVNALEAVLASTSCGEASLPQPSKAQPARQSWADIESDDEEETLGTDAKSPADKAQPARQCWADLESDEEEEVPRKDAEPAAPVEDGWTTVAKKERKVGAWERVPRAVREPAAREPAFREPAARPGKSAAARSEKILVHLEDGEFPVVRRLIGPGGANLRRIRDAHGTQVQLRGRGCGGTEPLHLLLTCTAPGANLRAACREAQALVRSVQEEFQRSARRAR